MRDTESASGECVLCDELDERRAPSLRLGLYPTPVARILLASEHFVLIPDISPLVPGHALMLSREHVPCFARLRRELIPEFQCFKGDVMQFFTETLGSAAFFEHGSMQDPPRSGACVQHAHIHVLPAAAPVDDWMADWGTVTTCQSIFSSDGVLAREISDYLAFENRDGTGYLATPLLAPLPCQFIRRQFASHLELDHWNWKTVFSRPSSFDTLVPEAFRRWRARSEAGLAGGSP